MIVGGHSEGTEHRGRSLKEKSAVVVAAEILDDGRTGNINFETIENFEADTLKYALKDMINCEADIVTDQHKSYEALKEEMNIETLKSEKGKAMEEIHKQIMLFKNWLRGIHHKCSKALLKKYLDEYKFRFNNRNRRQFYKFINKSSLFILLLGVIRRLELSPNSEQMLKIYSSPRPYCQTDVSYRF